MLIQYRSQIFWGNSLNSDTKEIIRTLITSFKDEAERYACDNEDYPLWNYYGERPMLSLMLQGIIRKYRNATALQEYGVYSDEDKFIGRADAFVNLGNRAVYIESKFEESAGKKNHWDNVVYKKYLNKVEEQAGKYRISRVEKRLLKQDYPNKSFLVLLVFHRILNVAKEHCKAIDEHWNDKMLLNSFYTFVHHDWLSIPEKDRPTEKFQRGLEIYGTIQKIN